MPREDPDNLQSSAYVNIIDLIGEGQIGGLVDNVDGDSLTEKRKINLLMELAYVIQTVN